MQLIGVYDRDLVEPLADVLRELGARAAFVVHGADGLDELSTTGPNRVADLRDGQVAAVCAGRRRLWACRRATLAQICAAATPSDNAAITRAILAGEPSPHATWCCSTPALALVVAGAAPTRRRKAWRWRPQAIDSGAAARVLEHLVAFTQAEAGMILDELIASTRARPARPQSRRAAGRAARAHRRPARAAATCCCGAARSRACRHHRRGQARLALQGRAQPGAGPRCAGRRAMPRAGAGAISVLTEPTRFHGQPGRSGRGAPGAVDAVGLALPLLRKDFIVDAYQL